MSKNIGKYLHKEMNKEAGLKHIAHRTKVVATVGPACDTYEKLLELVNAGVNVFRLNFSHGDHAGKAQIIEHVRNINLTQPFNISILADLQGPKLRVGEIENNYLEVKVGDILTFTNEKCVGTLEKIYVSYPNLADDVKLGNIILIDDGKIEVKVTDITKEKDVKVMVTLGGVISSKKGINLPDTKISLPALTEKDLADLEFIIEQKCDWVALSFVRSVKDIVILRSKLIEKKSKTKIIAKIEKPEAVRNINEIIEVADGVMVARGDLGVEIDLAQVPIIQKKIVKKCRAAGIPVIIATQMMESMITNFRPTRAEANDVGNAVYDGADALMLSAETSVGKFPVETVNSMRKIIQAIEHDQEIYYRMNQPDKNSKTFISDTLCYHAAELANQSGAKAIAAMTHSGYTAFRISSQRPKAGLFIFTDHKPILNTLNLVWGVRGMYYNKFESTDQTIDDIKNILKEDGYVGAGDVVIHVASTPLKKRSRVNTLKINVVD